MSHYPKVSYECDLQFTGNANFVDTSARVSLHTIRRPSLYPILPAAGHSRIYDEPSVCRCASTSASETTAMPMTHLTSMISLCDILLGRHVTRSRISVVHASLQLRAIPHAAVS
jgi:hypothetical protein